MKWKVYIYKNVFDNKPIEVKKASSDKELDDILKYCTKKQYAYCLQERK